MQEPPTSSSALLSDDETLQHLLEGLKEHENTYVSKVMTLRHEYLSHGRRWQHVQAQQEVLRAKSKRARARGAIPELAQAVKLVLFFPARALVPYQRCICVALLAMQT